MDDKLKNEITQKLSTASKNKSPQSITKVRDYFSIGRKFKKNSKLVLPHVDSNNIVFKKNDSAISCNPFQVPASYFILDLLTDSGTSSLKEEQKELKKYYSENVKSIEIFSYARLTPREHLNSIIADIFGKQFNFYPTLQGRAAEKLLLDALTGTKVLQAHGKIKKSMPFLLKKKLRGCNNILSNRPFDTTKGHIGNNSLHVKALTEMAEPQLFLNANDVFMGNIPEETLNKYSANKYGAILVTMTDNGGGGQPVSMKNYKMIVQKAHKDKKVLWLDACRIFENALFIKTFEKEYANKTIKDIVTEIASLADIITISFKKTYSHSGGAILINRNSHILSAKEIEVMDLIIKQSTTVNYGNGFNSYSGLTGEGMIEIISGLICAVNEEIVANRIAQVGLVGAYLREEYDVPIVSGGHALYIAADKILPKVALKNCPAEYLNAILMQGLQTRGCGLGLIVYGGRVDHGSRTTFSNHLSMDSLRLAIPRDVYTNEELISVLKVFGKAHKMGLFKNLSGGLKPLNYVDNGFYHFGGEYKIINKKEFDKVVKELRKLALEM